MDTNVTINLFYLLGLLGFSLLMTGLYLTVLAANQKQAQDHGIIASHLHTEVAHFTERYAKERRKRQRLSDAVSVLEKDLATTHAHVTAYLDELDLMKAANLNTVRAYNDMANEYAWFRSLVAAKDAHLYHYALTQSKAATTAEEDPPAVQDAVHA